MIDLAWPNILESEREWFRMWVDPAGRCLAIAVDRWNPARSIPTENRPLDRLHTVEVRRVNAATWTSVTT